MPSREFAEITFLDHADVFGEATELDSNAWVTEVKRSRAKRLPLTAAGVQSLRAEYTRSIGPVRAIAAEKTNLERTISDLVNEAYGLTPADTDLMWDVENRATEDADFAAAKGGIT